MTTAYVTNCPRATLLSRRFARVLRRLGTVVPGYGLFRYNPSNYLGRRTRNSPRSQQAKLGYNGTLDHLGCGGWSYPGRVCRVTLPNYVRAVLSEDPEAASRLNAPRPVAVEDGAPPRPAKLVPIRE